MDHYIYADNAATTKVSKRVLDVMMPYFTDEFGNASSWFYTLGQKSAAALEKARMQVAEALNAEPREIYFTSCGSESDNWALRGTARKLYAEGKRHIVTTVFEHHAILHTCEYLKKNGFDITYVKCDSKGLINPEDIKNAIRDDTALVSVMYANNEIGTIQPIKEIADVCHQKGVLFHTDAVQAVGHVHIDVKEQGIDMLSLSGHKIHAQKGIGVLYIKKGINLDNFIFGGAQEHDKRGGTENIPAIVGLGEAITASYENLDEKNKIITARRNKLIDGLLKYPHTRLNGDRDKRLAGNANISIEGVEGEALLLMLSMKGIYVSSGSACASKSLEPSHVILALGVPHEVAHCSLRFSIDEETTDADIDYILEVMPDIIKKLRDMSPLWEDIVKKDKK